MTSFWARPTAEADGGPFGRVLAEERRRNARQQRRERLGRAARIEELTKTAGTPVLVSEETRRRVGGHIGFSVARFVTLRGRLEPVQTYVPNA